jgi:hypothetical protein
VFRKYANVIYLEYTRDVVWDWNVFLKPMRCKAWSQSLWDLWDQVGGSWVIQGVPWKGILGPWPLPLSLFCFPASMRWTGLPYHVLLPWWTVLSQAQSNRAKGPWTEISETMSQNKYMKKCSTSWGREIQFKTTLRVYLNPVRMYTIKIANNICWWGWGGK